jgi:hypothetical protein
VCEARDLPVDLCDEHAVAHDPESLETRLHGGYPRRIAELPEEPRDRLGVVRLRVPDQRA